MTKKKAILILALIPVAGLLSLIILVYCSMLYVFFADTERLEKADVTAYNIAKKITENKLFTKRPVILKTFTDHSLLSLSVKSGIAASLNIPPLFPKIVFVNKKFIKHEHLDVIVAHELGHIEYDTSDENLAWQFAAKVCGDQRALSGLFAIQKEVEKIRQ